LTKAARHIYKFLDNYFGLYDNPEGIQFIVNNDDTVFVVLAIDPPPEPWIDYGLMYPCTPFPQFIRDFHFGSINELIALKQAEFWNMYRQGKVEIYCSIVVKDIFYALYYRITKKNTMIVRDDYDNEHEVGEIFYNPIQFMEYTQNHWLLMEG